MDLAHRHHRVVQGTHIYELQTEAAYPPYEMAMETQRIPRTLGPSFGLQASTLNQSAAPSRSVEQPWPKRVLSEIRDLLLLLSPDGRVMYASPSCKFVTGFDSAHLEQNLLSRFIHDDDKAVFTRELEECMAVARPLRCHVRIYKFDNSSCLLEAHGHPHLTPINAAGNQRQLCHGVFVLFRPYPTRSSQLLDSFLEHKVENIRLKERIAQLKEEEEEDLNAAQQAKQASSTITSYPVAQTTHQVFAPSGPSNFASLRDTSTSGEENESSDTLDNVNEPDSQPLLDQAISRAVAQGEDMSHIDGIELMTGLFYGDGERSQGISTGIRHGRLIQCTGVPSNPTLIATDGERRKRLKGEYMCTDCGTADSPEWRKGPEGPKTLCNACGLRWAKKEKKRQDAP
ncbi:hypothetical protein ARAM_007682 [Aspergillus rambellii]|uniref:GATA transcription factor LreB n=2 Tax=Aspergillus subgen. Nidulantes TaxID=2720870 RepID=A0A0F8U4F2_9EURO|nr:hypothetical protein ARAM_007682 [Aspergillus rambellii]